ncbi:SMI1/KNR4 family protein [Kitasatospora sp. NPDC056184]|uniref:SMI1/KNR4 family protein n=1 Tax=Kitasatospora sp. NPDC056184 TaxID=3345738 RepID=UPI0035E2D568
MDDQLWAGVRERVQALAGTSAAEAGRRPFGAIGHRFRLQPVLSPAELAGLEAQIGVRLPWEYRTFLLAVGAGGAGPAYGVFPVQHESGRWRWTGDGADLADFSRLAEPFPVHGPAPAVVEKLLEECPREQDFDEIEDFDTAYEGWDRQWGAVMWNPERTVGALAICHLGCAARQWLVISGPQRGRIWSDDRVDEVDLAPLQNQDGQPVTFARWYLDWLEHAEQQGH